MVAGRSCTARAPSRKVARNQAWFAAAEERIDAAKRSAVSTGPLSALLHLHFQPIDLVVFQEPLPRRAGDLFLEGVSRLYAFSVYPGRT